MRREFLRRANDEAGHQGMERTLDRLKTMGYWVGMATTVYECVVSCNICQKAKLTIPTRAPLLNTHLVDLYKCYKYVDVLEVPPCSEGNKYLLVIEDSLSK